MSGKQIRRFFTPEVVQTSAMDCGPAALKCLLEGFGVKVSYGRLREACQTDVDGTSIDTIEEVATQLGLQAEQVMLPQDHLTLPDSEALPALVITRNPDRTHHFVVVWRRLGPFFQVMDPAIGRRWLRGSELLKELYIHQMEIAAEHWRDWAHSESFLRGLRARLAGLQVKAEAASRLTEAALADNGWRSMAALDAAVRMVDSLVQAGALRGRLRTATLVGALFERARRADEATEIVPESYWMVRPASPQEQAQGQLLVRGAVLVAVMGRRAISPSTSQNDEEDSARRRLSPELLAALKEKPSRPGRELLGFVRADGWLTPTLLLTALCLAAGGVIVEALLFRTLFDLGGKLGVSGQRMGALAGVVTFSAAMLCLELPLAATLLRYGRRLETRLRLAFLEKIPRLDDRYFQSRLISDMADRSHNIQMLRNLPTLAGHFLRLLFELCLTTAGIIWLDPAGLFSALAVSAIALTLPLLMQPRLMERDLKIRTHNGALSRFYLDALLGLVPIRTHGAANAVRGEHEGVLVEWIHANHGLLRSVVHAETIQGLTGFGLACWLLFDHLSRGNEVGAVLLLVYWALSLPVIGQEIALIARQYPTQRNIALRLLEPLGAPEEDRLEDGDQVPAEKESSHRAKRHEWSPERRGSQGVAIRLEDVTVRAAGNVILQGVDLNIEAGADLAIVGPSGAGKSSLVGLLLGWHRAAQGAIFVDGEPLDRRKLEQLRRHTAWVDPAVQLWNRSLLENLHYGAAPGSLVPMGTILETADLRRVLEKLPNGLQTRLGEGGALVSGGEGQRVRLGRAMMRTDARLVILDEPFRGLDRERRRDLLARARELWRDTTLICITHDVGETRDFDRVLVVDGGRVAEDGAPLDLVQRAGSLYGKLLSAEDSVRTGLWESDTWRQVRLDEGRLMEDNAGGKEGHRGADPASWATHPFPAVIRQNQRPNGALIPPSGARNGECQTTREILG